MKYTYAVVSIAAAPTVLAAVSAYFVVSLRSDSIEDSPSSTVRITIDASETIAGVKMPLVGFVHGITYDEEKDYSKTIELVSALKPSSWRLAGYNGVYEFVVNAAKFPDTSGTLITINFQTIFNQQYGFPIGVAPCSADVSRCFQSYDELKSAWTATADELLTKIDTAGMRMDYFDVFAEPNWGWENVTTEQLFELFTIAHDAARRHDPDVKIIGVDLAGFETHPESFQGVYNAFFDHLIARKLRVDVVSWHEFRYPEEVLARADMMRQMIAERPALCEPTCPEMHVNEYAGPEYHLIPGFNVGWLYYLEAVGVDQADRACWDGLGSRWHKWSSCWASMNGMFLEDNVTPQPTYWVYKAYADLPTARVRTKSSHPRTVALVGKDDAKKEIRMLVGTYESGAHNTTVTIQHYPYDSASVEVEISKIPNFGNVPRALPALDAPNVAMVTPVDGTLTFTLDNVQEGEAYSIVVRGPQPLRN